MTEQERRALFFKVTGQVYAMTSMGIYNAFCKGLEAGYEAGRKDENEACAKVCEELGEYWSAYKDTALLNGNVELSIAASGEPRAAASIAAAIRARREQ